MRSAIWFFVGSSLGLWPSTKCNGALHFRTYAHCRHGLSIPRRVERSVISVATVFVWPSLFLREPFNSHLRNLQVDVLDAINLRTMMDDRRPVERSFAEQFPVVAELQQQGLIRHLGLSNVTAAQIEEAQSIAPVACVRNMFNVVNRQDGRLVDALAQQGIAYVPFFPLGGFTPLQSSTLSEVASSLDATALALLQTFESSNECIEQVTDSRHHAPACREDRVDKARRAGETRQHLLQATGLNVGLDQLPGEHCHADAR